MKEKVETVCKLTVSGCLGLFFGIIVFGVALAGFYAYASSQQKESVDIEKVSKKEKQFASDLSDEKYLERRVEMYESAVVLSLKTEVSSFTDTDEKKKFTSNLSAALKDGKITNYEYGVILQDYDLAKSAHSKYLLINQ